MSAGWSRLPGSYCSLRQGISWGRMDEQWASSEDPQGKLPWAAALLVSPKLKREMYPRHFTQLLIYLVFSVAWAMKLMKVSCILCSWILYSPMKTEHIIALSAVWKYRCPALISSYFHEMYRDLWDFCLPIKFRSGQATNSRVAWGEMPTVYRKRQTPHYHTGLLSCIKQDKRL